MGQLIKLKVIEDKWANVKIDLTLLQKANITDLFSSGQSIENCKTEDEINYYLYLKDLHDAVPGLIIDGPDLSDDEDMWNMTEVMFSEE